MKNGQLIMAGIIIAVGLLACQEVAKKQKEITEESVEKVPTKEDLVERGKFLVKVGGCEHCHSPKMMTEQGPVIDSERYMSGHPTDGYIPEILEGFIPGPMLLFNGDLTVAIGPWGTSFGANLTPHETGIGNWSLEQFKNSIRKGKYKGLDGSRPLMPPMPWQSISEALSDEDLEAVYTYLMSITPVENLVPAYIPPANS